MIKVELHDPSDKKIQVLSGAKAGAYYEQLNSDGVGSFKIHRLDADAIAYNILLGGIDGWIIHLLRKPPKINPTDPEPAFVDRFSFVVEGRVLGIDKQEDANAWITVSGRGTLCLLEDRLAFPPGFDGVTPSTITAQWQQYTAQPGGSIMAAEIDRSNSRFATTLTHTVTTDTDSQTLKLRFDNLRKLHDYLVQNGPMDAQMVGLDYQAVNQRGTDKSATVAIQLGPQDSLLGLQLEGDARPVKNWVIAQGTAEGINAPLAVSSDAPSIAALRRREGFVSTRNTDNATQLGLVANGAITQFKAVDQRITVSFFDSTHTQLYRDFDLGDFVNLNVVLLNWLNKYRVVGIQVSDPDTATSGEYEKVSLDLNDIRTEYLLKLQKGAQSTADSLNVLGAQPQGAPWLDSQAYPDSCDATHPFHFDAFVPSRVLKINSVKLSFFLQAFRSPVAGANTVTSGASSASSSSSGSNHNHATPNHSHVLFTTTTALGLNAANPYITTGGQKVSLVVETPAVGTISTDTSGGGGTSSAEGSHTHGIPHTHDLTPTLSYGIFESTVATGVTVTINGTDRTVALGGGTGFTTNQIELEVGLWFTIGALNTVDLTPTGNGRILGHLSSYGYIQSA